MNTERWMYGVLDAVALMESKFPSAKVRNELKLLESEPYMSVSVEVEAAVDDETVADRIDEVRDWWCAVPRTGPVVLFEVINTTPKVKRG